MTPEEIRKLKLVQQMQMPDIDIEADEPLVFKQPQFEDMPATEEPREYSEKDNSAQYIGDAVAAAGPGLLALLGGASSDMTSSLFDKGNAYAMKRGSQEEITKANTSVIDVNGEPLNIRSRDAIGEKPYYQSKIGSLGSLSGQVSGIPKDMYNPKTGERATVQQYKDGTAFKYGTKIQIPDIAEWQKDLGVGTATGTDTKGTKTTDQYDRNKPSKKENVKTSSGYGTLTGVPEQTRKSVDKLTEKYAKDTDILETKKNELSNAISILSRKDANPTELTAAREALIRSVTTETRLTEEDVQRALGNDFRAVGNQLLSTIGNKTFQEMNDTQRKEFLKAADTLKKRLENALNFSYDKTKQRASALPDGKKYFESQTPKRTQSSSLKEADMIKLKKEAAAKYGEGSEKYNKFIDFYNSKMGL